MDDLQIFSHLLCFVIFPSYIPVALNMFPYFPYHYIRHIVTMRPRLRFICQSYAGPVNFLDRQPVRLQ